MIRPNECRPGARVIMPDGETGTVVGVETLPIEGQWLTVRLQPQGIHADQFKRIRPRELTYPAEAQLASNAETLLDALVAAVAELEAELENDPEPDDLTGLRRVIDQGNAAIRKAQA